MEPGLAGGKDGRSLAAILFYEFCGAALITYAFNFSGSNN